VVNVRDLGSSGHAVGYFSMADTEHTPTAERYDDDSMAENEYSGSERQYREVYNGATDEGEPSEFDGRLDDDVGSAGADDTDAEDIKDERGRSGRKRRRTPNYPQLSDEIESGATQDEAEDEATSTCSDDLDEEDEQPPSDPNVIEEITQFQATFQGIGNRFRLINKIGEGAQDTG
jgi:hypothetical protein